MMCTLPPTWLAGYPQSVEWEVCVWGPSRVRWCGGDVVVVIVVGGGGEECGKILQNTAA